MKKKTMTVVGAGLCGTLLALRLAQRGYQVQLFEKLPDMRTTELGAGRSINLALSDRGFKALRMAGLEDEIREVVIPMRGRLIHKLDGEQWLSPYSGRAHEFINSVSRPGLNIALLNAAEQLDNIDIYFRHKCLGVDLDSGTVRFGRADRKEMIVEADYVFGTDGAGSAVRRSIFARSAELRFDYAQDFLDHGYKELTIPPAAGGGWRIEKNALHIWPRQDYMLIALPNLDGSFTVTLFLAFDGEPGFNQLTAGANVRAFFNDVFPTAAAHMPGLVEEFFDNPTGILGTIKCYPWRAGKALLMGDAAHAIVPFYGQGMNCALEDVWYLDQLLDQHGEDWDTVLDAYQAGRKQDTDAIADLALENYYEMRDHVDNPDFRLKRQLEMQLEATYPEYSSKYNLVTFNEDIPYSEALQHGHAQDAYLLDLCRGRKSVEEFDLGRLFRELGELNP
ncbi:MAG: NAD(P)/FAD-dependent oxidoreductase [Saprospiraceae bacterium]|nr:NAD(P)/FAD-dependent oxidoreductase [Saprospiraceae bacterium]